MNIDTSTWITTMNSVENFVAWVNGSDKLPANYRFHVDTPGRKYVRVYFTTHTDSETGKRRGASVHCFVDLATGDMYKPASWKSPAKGVRCNVHTLLEDGETRALFDWAGGYLYKGRS